MKRAAYFAFALANTLGVSSQVSSHGISNPLLCGLFAVLAVTFLTIALVSKSA